MCILRNLIENASIFLTVMTKGQAKYFCSSLKRLLRRGQLGHAHFQCHVTAQGRNWEIYLLKQFHYVSCSIK